MPQFRGRDRRGRSNRSGRGRRGSGLKLAPRHVLMNGVNNMRKTWTTMRPYLKKIEDERGQELIDGLMRDLLSILKALRGAIEDYA